MKRKLNILWKISAAMAFTLMLLISPSCTDDFEELNKAPWAISEDNVPIEYLFQNSVSNSKMDPHISERIFLLYWGSAARHYRYDGLATGNDNDSWSGDYWSRGFFWGWVTSLQNVIDIGKKREAAGIIKPYEKNVVQMARIYKVMLFSNFADTFGDIPYFQALDGKTDYPLFDPVKDIYYDFFKELREASEALDPTVSAALIGNSDMIYYGDAAKWKKLANSLRLRYAMRLSEVDRPKARAEAEAAAAAPGGLLKELVEIASIPQGGGWDGLTGVFTRSWTTMEMTLELSNLMTGLGSIAFKDPNNVFTKRDVRNYIGIYAPRLIPKTNDPRAQYIQEGVPATVDPRASVFFAFPGTADHNWTSAQNYTYNAVTEEGKTVTINTRYVWNARPHGTYGPLGAQAPTGFWDAGNRVVMAKKYRQGVGLRQELYGPWETYFLLAEGAYYGWNMGGNAKDFYNAGIEQSFKHHGLTADYAAYIASNEYNLNGTSVNFDHVAEPVNYTITEGPNAGFQYKYPENTGFGTTKNDRLTKIITQKYIANYPWNPVEGWNDHRRLNLPFFVNPAEETDLVNINLKPNESHPDNFPRRVTYPTRIERENPVAWEKIVSSGFVNKTYTKLWWAK
jgi:hypothetical protein